MFWLMVGIITILLCLILLYLMNLNKYWKNKGAPQTNPPILIGDGWEVILLRNKAFAEMLIDIYKQAGDNRYYGMYQVFQPTLLIKDPNLIKQITVKDFDHFQDRRKLMPEDVDPLWSRNLFALRGHKWKEMRSTLSPSFTSSKMRMIFILISECAEEMAEHFLSKSDQELANLEMKDAFTRLANDVIASAAFGIKCDSLNQRDNLFYLMGKKATNFGNMKFVFKAFTIILAPTIAKILNLKLFPDDVSDFFRGIVKVTIKNREEKGIVRHDMIQLLMEARKNGLKYEENNGIIDTGFATVQESDIGKTKKDVKYQITDDDIAAQSLIFFFAGFDTVSNLMTFMAYELAVNPDVQEKLIQEIDEFRENCSGKITYEELLKMKYLDMVVSESLRKWPIPLVVERAVTKPYTIPPVNPNENPIHLDIDDLLWIPAFAIHRDPKLYPNPDKFDPERFNEENKGNIKPYTYMPFGLGPRNCIGSRFALLEIKTTFFHLLSRFQLVVTKKTQIPVQINRKLFNVSAENGVWLGMKRRNT